ncbi:hypothetical protein C9374_013522 [Naegleria lovaniensis]|uniref:Uncharacterized protein n=1 Tax=Naegleria lovaniensis TaxID=51637 RepID=A0AA88H2G6_NAELO|nr:uncharacterized protein C9374_013522 [Naegleria lovaniensis]KAG2392037.1 hypothetical protein C9374_013522 [Naegleria lovaniensis]
MSPHESTKKSQSSSSSSSSASSGKKPSKYHIKNKRHQQHQSARSNKHFMITGQMSGTGFRRRIATVNDEEVDQEELLAIQQEEQMKRLKYGKRQLLDNSFRFKTEEEDEDEKTPQAEEKKMKAKLQHELNRMEKETMMMISNSVTLTQTFGSATSRGLLEWEETEKEDYSTTYDTIMRTLFYLDQAELAKQIKNPQISLEERLDLIDICGRTESTLPTMENNHIHETFDNQSTKKDFIPIGQFLSGAIDVTSMERNDHVQYTDDDEASLSDDDETQEKIPSFENVDNIEHVEGVTIGSSDDVNACNIIEMKEQTPIDILDEIVQESEKPSVTQRNNMVLNTSTPTISSTKSEPVKIIDTADDVLDDLLSLSQNTPSNVSPSITNIFTQSNNTRSTTVIKTVSTETPKPTNLPVTPPKEETKELDEWLDDLIN